MNYYFLKTQRQAVTPCPHRAVLTCIEQMPADSGTVSRFFLIIAQAWNAVKKRAGKFLLWKPLPFSLLLSFFLFLLNRAPVPHRAFLVREDLGGSTTVSIPEEGCTSGLRAAFIGSGGSRWCCLYFPNQRLKICMFLCGLIFFDFRMLLGRYMWQS